ncbi:MAG: RNA methyltransferase [Rhodothermales bacterium]|nr:RNA methyltransferase [Rhodothermales bacterium]
MTRIPEGAQSMDALLKAASRLPRTIEAAGRALEPEEVVELLRPYLSDARAGRIDDVVASRCGDIAVVVDGLANTGNVAAVMRTAEGLGYLHFHILSRAIPYKHSARTTQGTEKWLDVNVWDEPVDGIHALQKRGYRVLATHLDERARPLDAFDFSIPTALVFGNELGGVSPEVLDAADGTCIIPMDGFAQSFNISVAAATCLYHARADRVRRLGRHGDLGEEDRRWLKAAYAYRAVGHAQEILDREIAAASDPSNADPAGPAG